MKTVRKMKMMKIVKRMKKSRMINIRTAVIKAMQVRRRYPKIERS